MTARVAFNRIQILIIRKTLNALTGKTQIPASLVVYSYQALSTQDNATGSKSL